MIPIDTIRNREVVASAAEAADFLRSFPWCGKIERGYLACWRPGLFGVFRFHITPKKNSVKDIHVWVVVHETPRACSVCDEAENWKDALKDFICEMRRWIRSGPRTVDTVVLEEQLVTLDGVWIKEEREGLPQIDFSDVLSIEDEGPIPIS